MMPAVLRAFLTCLTMFHMCIPMFQVDDEQNKTKNRDETDLQWSF